MATERPAAAGGLPVVLRVPLLLLGMASMLGGVVAGLARIGWQLPVARTELVLLHGPLMIAAFFGAVIGLERAVALGHRWAFLAPLASGLGGVALLADVPVVVAQALLVGGALLLALSTLRAAQRQPALHACLLVLAAFLAALAAAAWALGRMPAAIAGWIGFLVLTIAGERLELSRFLPPSLAARRVFVGIVAVHLAALVAVWFGAEPEGWRLLGASLMAFALWLLRQDVARRTVRQPGLPGFIARCLLSGYGWLLVGGALLFLQPPLAFLMDAALHAIFVGFVLAMVFGHAPVIFPAVVRVRLPYHASFLLPLVLLHLSLLLRVGGDLAGDPALRAWGGAGNALCIAVFILTMLAAALRGRRDQAG